jgi:hypothetical protein
MRFNSIDSQLTDTQIEAAQKKFDGLLLELGCRKDNQHIGTGMGGNTHQLITLFSMEHTLSNQPHDIQVSGASISWGANWLAETSRKDIRVRLNQVFESIDTCCQRPAVDFEADRLNGYPIDRSYANQELLRSLENGSYQLDKTISNIEQFRQARFICQELSARLDQNDTSLINAAGLAMQQFSAETVLVALHKFVGIERLVRFEMDEHFAWAWLLLNMNKRADA